MHYIAKEEKLELKFEPGKGAWTYHIQIPNTKHLKGKWGSLKVSGFIDGFKIEAKNLFTITGQDKLLSVNNAVRKAINKNGGDTVTVTLYLIDQKQPITGEEISETLKESGVLNEFEKLSADEKNKILEKILSQKTEEKQLQLIVSYINKLTG
ncbi:MAG: DUF1905 domain-containing protein [Lacibacter sp.]|jgi:hypothetical protein|nr:DUF1905 domain-containing protein [Lacibacter sp.]